jgi:hypothetical protein
MTVPRIVFASLCCGVAGLASSIALASPRPDDPYLSPDSTFVRTLYAAPVPSGIPELLVLEAELDIAGDEGRQAVSRYVYLKTLATIDGTKLEVPPNLDRLVFTTPPSTREASEKFMRETLEPVSFEEDPQASTPTIVAHLRSLRSNAIQNFQGNIVVGEGRARRTITCALPDSKRRLYKGDEVTVTCTFRGNWTDERASILNALQSTSPAPRFELSSVEFVDPGVRVGANGNVIWWNLPDARRQAAAEIERASCWDRGGCFRVLSRDISANPTTYVLSFILVMVIGIFVVKRLFARRR